MSSSHTVERDFELLGEVLEESEEPLYNEGEFIPGPGKKRESAEKCSSGCSFAKMEGTARQPLLFLCREHRRVHICGAQCQHQIISHEDSSCEWTGEMMHQKLIAEIVNCHQIRARSQSCASSSSAHEQCRHQTRNTRIREAMEEVAKICEPAVTLIENKPGSFVKALRDYFHRVHKATTAFSKSGLNKKSVVTPPDFLFLFAHYTLMQADCSIWARMCVPSPDWYYNPQKDTFQEIRENDEEPSQDSRAYTSGAQSVEYYKVGSVY